MTNPVIRLRYTRKRANDLEHRPWFIDVGALWGARGWNRPQWVGPFKTAAGAMHLIMDEELSQ